MTEDRDLDILQYNTVFTLPETNSSPLKIGRLTWKGSYSNHPFLGVKLAVSFREGIYFFHLALIQGCTCDVIYIFYSKFHLQLELFVSKCDYLGIFCFFSS